MTYDHCRELDERLRDPHWISDRKRLIAWLDGLSNVDSCIELGLRQAGEKEDWLVFESYLLAAHRHPSSSFTAVLCEVLSHQSDEVNNEDIVDVLADIRDPAAVGCLEATLWWQPPWDEYRQLAVKCVWALAAIGTPDAVAVLRDAASCEATQVRDAAVHKLNLAGS
ncbi:MAG: HEAT repeat domain-containing protein [Pseudonocardiaceae bacterium]